jgi:prolyl oligopeptidase
MMPQAPAGQSLTYPATRRDSTVDTYHGTTVADPYRWLEHLESPETLSWVDSQRRVTEAYFARTPTREIVRERLTAVWNYSRTDVPWREAGRVFFTENSGLQRQPVLFVQESVGDVARALLDPQDLSPDGSIAVGDFSVSPDGRWLAYSRSRGGADTGETRVRALDSRQDLGDSVSGTLGTVCWTFDGNGFFYTRSPAAPPGDAAGARIDKQLFYHALGRAQDEDRLIGEWKDNYRWLYCMLSDDGRRAIVVAERGAQSRMYVLDLGDPLAPNVSAPLVPLLADREAQHTPLGTVGDTLYVLTDLDAPRRRVIALDLSSGPRATVRTVIAESSEVIQTATVAGDRLALHYLVDVTSRLRLFTLAGRLAGDVALPGVGAIGWPLNGRHSSPELLYSFRSFLSPSTVYRLDLQTGISAPFRPPHLSFDASRFETRQVFYTSNDGTRVPMFITAKKDLRLDGSHPTLLTGYGGFGAISGPRYEPDIALWLELGGIYALANIRGGGEYGETWHLAGSRHRKQTSFDDFIAAAEYLRDRGYTRPARLAMYGYSNGGLLVGAMITQRPDLFAAAVPNAGHYDMLRFHRFTVGAGWIPEFGTPESPEDYRYLRAYSPLHHVRSGPCYPATLILAADHDDRVVPSHAYKFTAALQAAQACGRPIVLRLARDASHSYASADAAIAERADMWSFIAEQLDMRIER